MNIIYRIECAICFKKLKHIYTIPNMPIKLCCTDEPDYITENISFSICEECNTIQLDKLIPLDILYSSSHNTVSVGKTWENYFEMICNKIHPCIMNKTVLEIGDPSGRIANTVEGYAKWYIVEPNKNQNIIFKENIHFICDFFDEHFSISEKIDVIVHSHVFEHIYSPNIFLKKCYEILQDEGEMIFGIPNMEHIGKNELAPCLGIFFEHSIFLNKENVSYLLEKNGFKILEICDYENHSNIYHVKKYIGNLNYNKLCLFNYSILFIETIEKWIQFISHCNIEIGKSNDNNVYIFGASYNTQYLLSLGLYHSLLDYKIQGILDNCKDKQGKYLSGYALQIFTPDIIKNQDNCIVIIKNGYYTNEIVQQLKCLNDKIMILC